MIVAADLGLVLSITKVFAGVAKSGTEKRCVFLAISSQQVVRRRINRRLPQKIVDTPRGRQFDFRDTRGCVSNLALQAM